MALSLVVVWISASGVLLNHIHQWGIADKLVSQPWLIGHYAAFEPRYFRIDESRWLVQQPTGEIVFDKRTIGQCDTPLLGIAKAGNIYASVCADRLFLSLVNGVLLEQIAEENGLPQMIDSVGEIAGQIALRSAGKWYVFDDVAFEFSLSDSVATVAGAETPPQPVAQYYAEQAGLPPVSIERFLLDLHTGAFWGKSNTLVSDIAAILLILIAVGGVWVWLTKPGRFG